MYLKEIVSLINETCGVLVSKATVCRTLKRYGMTRKKVQRVACQRSTILRAKFMSEALVYNRDKFVWIDETGSDRRNCLRKYGYSLRGYRAVKNSLIISRGQRVNAIAAITQQGLLSYQLVTSTVDSSVFFDFIRGSVIPNMLPFDGVNPSSIVIMDNASIHHTQEVIQLFTQAGILILFLPPYSPDLNPIEEMFSYIKYYLKLHEEILCATNLMTLLQSAFENVRQEQCQGWIDDSGY